MNQLNNIKIPLYQMKPENLFSRRATDYVKYRPTYPSVSIEKILGNLGEASQIIAADIGAGTGIASHLLASKGVRVIAIEPNTSMREAAEPHPLIEFRNATAEITNLPDKSIDLVTSFQAFHWFNPVPTLQEFRRILKPSGRLALVWNDWAKNDKFFTEFSDIIQQAASSERPKEKQRGTENSLLSSPCFARIQHFRFSHVHKLDFPGLIGYAKSKSFVAQSGEKEEKLFVNLQYLYSRYVDDSGCVSLNYLTNMFIAEPQYSELTKYIAPWRGKLLSRWWKLRK